MNRERVANVIVMKPRTYTAKALEVPWETTNFMLSGTLDGFIDFATPASGTYPLSLGEARGLIAALEAAIADVEAHCLHDRDTLLEKRP